jgi:uncharacterized membrane protein
MQCNSSQEINSQQLTNLTSIANSSVLKPRYVIQQEIQQAFNEGHLSFRSITLYQEEKYLTKEKKAPRPVYTVAPNIPTAMREIRRPTIGLIGAAALFSFKGNAFTDLLVSGGNPEREFSPKNIANSESLLKKRYEIANRIWEVYRRSTSGHLKADGFFSLPKFKCYMPTNYILDHSEEVKSQYTTENIKLFCLSERDPRNIIEILTEKQKLEETLNIKAKLPIGIFSETKGSLTIIFEEDLNINTIQNNENILQYYTTFINGNFRNTLASMIPLSSKIKILSDNKKIGLSDKATLEKLSRQIKLNHQLANLIENFEEYQLQDLETLIQQGADINSYMGSSFADKLYVLYRCTQEKENLKHFLDILECLLVNNGEFSGDDIINMFASDENKPFLYLFTVAYSISNNVSSKIKTCMHTVTVMFASIIAENNIAFITLFDEIIHKRATKTKLKDLIAYNLHIHPLITKYTLPIITNKNYTEFIIILFFYGITKEDLIDIKANHLNLDTVLWEDKSAGMILDEYISLWDNHKKHPIYNIWQENLQQEKQRIQPIKDRFSAKFNPNSAFSKDIISNANKMLDDILSCMYTNKLDFQLPVNTDDATISAILEHYYRRPGINQAYKAISDEKIPNIWKSIHSSSHVLRAYNNATWYMELLEKFKLTSFSVEEKVLLKLAVVYHDASAEDVSKENEEQKSADYFRRDLSGKFPAQLLEKVALALESKEDDIHDIEKQTNDEDLKKYIIVIRNADRMDYGRCSTIGYDFPNLTTTSSAAAFNSVLLNLPEEEKVQFTNIQEKKTLFQRHLEAALHGAIDLATVAGGHNKDLREKGSYDNRYKLTIDNQRIKIAFEQTDIPVSQLNEILDNNVRRKIAQLAGIHTCTDLEHKTCNPDTTEGITHGIHSSWLELKQVKVPEIMTHLEKMQIEHDFSLLSQETQDTINLEVARLKTEGIKMSLGTLTQNTLKSDAAKETLKKHGITVTNELRARGFNDSGEQVYHEMLVPIKIKNTYA